MLPYLPLGPILIQLPGLALLAGGWVGSAPAARAGAPGPVWCGPRQRLPLRPTLDALAPGLAAFLVALGVAHFLSGDAFGAPAYRPDDQVPLPWAIHLWGEYR